VNNTLTNGFKLLELLAASNAERSVTELTEEMGRPASHVCRLLKTLVATGYVEQNPATRKYWVSMRLLTLAHVRLANLDFRRIGHPFALRLADDLNAAVYLSQPSRGLSIMVDVANPRDVTLDAGLVVGQIHSIRHSASGKLCAAYADLKERKSLIEMLEEEGQPFKKSAWLAELKAIRRVGIAVRRQADLLALAVPVFQAGGIFCGALGVYFATKTKLTPAIETAARQAAGGISFALGYPIST